MIQQQRELAVHMSNRQFSLLKMVKNSRSRTLNIDEVANINQITIGSLVRESRGYLKETKAKDGLVLTPAGEKACSSFEGADFFRRVASFHFSSHLHLNVPNTERATRHQPAKKKTNQRRAA